MAAIDSFGAISVPLPSTLVRLLARAENPKERKRKRSFTSTPLCDAGKGDEGGVIPPPPHLPFGMSTHGFGSAGQHSEQRKTKYRKEGRDWGVENRSRTERRAEHLSREEGGEGGKPGTPRDVRERRRAGIVVGWRPAR